MSVNIFQKQLSDLGIPSWKPKSDMIAFKFKVPIGRFRDKEIEIAIEPKSFPQIPPTGIYIRPHLLPIKSGGTLPLGGIHERNIPTKEWQYWSRKYNNWDKDEKTVKTYIEFIKSIFDFK